MSNTLEAEHAQSWWKGDKANIKNYSQNETQSNSKVEGVGVFFCIITLIGTKLGAGIIGLPFAIYKIGYVTALWIQLAYHTIEENSIKIY